MLPAVSPKPYRPRGLEPGEERYMEEWKFDKISSNVGSNVISNDLKRRANNVSAGSRAYGYRLDPAAGTTATRIIKERRRNSTAARLERGM